MAESGSLGETTFEAASPSDLDNPSTAPGLSPGRENAGIQSAPTNEPEQAIQQRRVTMMKQIKTELLAQNRREDRQTSIERTTEQLIDAFQNRGMVDATELIRCAREEGMDAGPIRGGFVFAVLETGS